MSCPVCRAAKALRFGWLCVVLFFFSLSFLPHSAHAARSSRTGSHVAKKKKGSKKRANRSSTRSSRLRRATKSKYPPLREAGSSVQQMAAPPPPPPVSLPAAPSHGRPPKKTATKVRKGPPSDSELLEEAQAAYVRGERQRAIDLALKVAQKNGETSSSAWRFIGLAACSVRSQRLATRAYKSLESSTDQRTISDACRRNGLSFHDNEFVAE